MRCSWPLRGRLRSASPRRFGAIRVFAGGFLAGLASPGSPVIPKGGPADTPAWDAEDEAPASMQLPLRDDIVCAAALCIPSQARSQAELGIEGHLMKYAGQPLGDIQRIRVIGPILPILPIPSTTPTQRLTTRSPFSSRAFRRSET
jgi:hypothetical protein